MKTKRFLSYTTVLLAANAVFGQHVPYQPTNEEKTQIELVAQLKSQRVDYRSFLEQAFKTKILFFGQVIDQNGIPVEGAQVSYSASSDLRALGGRSDRHKLISGKAGVFTISTNGTDMFVSVEKEGYRPVEVSRPDAGRGVQAGERVGSGVRIQYFDMSGKPDRNHHPSEKSPVQFTIRKIGKLEQLEHIDGCFWVKSDGTPRVLSLDANGSKTHCIEVICRSEYNRPIRSPGAERRYDWLFEVRVNDGGIQELRDEGFEAPLEGYKPNLIVVKMDAGDPKWNDRFRDKLYYVRFGDGVCARIRIDLGGTSLKGNIDDPYVYLESWLNPDPKSRNLETKPGQ